MTKRQKIAEVYAPLLIDKSVDIHDVLYNSNGWITREDFLAYCKKSGDIDEIENTGIIRPKFLRGIENNNGYKKVEIDGLPNINGGRYMAVFKTDPTKSVELIFTTGTAKFWLKHVSHYKEHYTNLPLY